MKFIKYIIVVFFILLTIFLIYPSKKFVSAVSCRADEQACGNVCCDVRTGERCVDSSKNKCSGGGGGGSSGTAAAAVITCTDQCSVSCEQCSYEGGCQLAGGSWITRRCDKGYCSKSCGGGTCYQDDPNNAIACHAQSCNTQACPTPIPTNTPIPTATPTPTGAAPTVTISPTIPVSTPTNVPGCICDTTANTCATVCPVNQTLNKWSGATAANISYTTPMKCMLANVNYFTTTPPVTQANPNCNRNMRPKGDANGDGAINFLGDYLNYVRLFSGGKIASDINPDINGDGLITPDDGTIIRSNMVQQ